MFLAFGIFTTEGEKIMMVMMMMMMTMII